MKVNYYLDVEYGVIYINPEDSNLSPKLVEIINQAIKTTPGSDELHKAELFGFMVRLELTRGVDYKAVFTQFVLGTLDDPGVYLSIKEKYTDIQDF